MSIHVAVGLVPVECFDHEGLHQLQNSFVTDEDPETTPKIWAPL